MTVTAERETIAPVVLTTADGESRGAHTWPDGSYACPFCDSPVFSPEGWQEHEDANAAHYAKRGEEYTREPYRHGKDYEARTCGNPCCLVHLTGEALAGYRRKQADKQRREDERTREDERRKAEAQAAEDARTLRTVLLGEVRQTALELGFAWACTHVEPAHADKKTGEWCAEVACMAQGWDRDEYTAHMRGHGKRLESGTYEQVRLSRKVPGAKFRKPEIPLLKWVHWTEEHTPEATCNGCSHTINQHQAAGGTIGGTAYDCRECDCERRYFGDFARHETQTAERRGQFLAEAGPHSVWVVPFEPAPWETGPHAKPVELHIIEPGRYSAHYSKYERRDADRRAKARKAAEHAATVPA